MAKLPWFKLYAQDLMADRRFRNLSGQQMGAFLWLLCEQWTEGDIPFDVIEVLPGMPKGIDDTAVAYVLQVFFPPDPDTNRRRHPKLAEQQEAMVAVQEVREETLRVARAAKSLQHNAPSVYRTDIRPDIRGRTRSRNRNIELTDSPPEVTMPDPNVQAVVVAANTGLRDNPQMRQEGALRPFQAGHAEQAVKDWLADGIPLAVILEAVGGVCRRFQPKGTDRRIGSFKYFDGAVRKAYAESQPQVDPMEAVIAQMQADHDRGAE